jgi:hypothetical protein
LIPFHLGCKWTVDYFLTGCAGGLVAVLILPGTYLTLPSFRKVNGDWRFYLGALARIGVAGIAGCVMDCNNRNSFFGGFFAWHGFRFLADDGWRWLRTRLRKLFGLPNNDGE